jgi:hypothetical protein
VLPKITFELANLACVNVPVEMLLALSAVNAEPLPVNTPVLAVNAGAVMVSECKRAGVPVGTPLEVKYERKDNKIKIYTLTLLG